MINSNELRLGNYLLHKTGVRILPVKCNYHHFELLEKGLAKEMFAVALKADNLLKCGFLENKKYYQLPEAREFILTLPVMGTGKNEINAYINGTAACYARATVNDLVISNNIHSMHQLQNLYYALVGAELDVDL